MKHDLDHISVDFDVTISNETVQNFFTATAWSLSTKPSTPPTLATNFRYGEFEVLKKLGISLQKVLHGEQKYRFVIDLHPVTLYKCKTFIANFHEKSGSKGSLAFYQIQTDINDEHGNLCVECTSTLVVREPAPANQSKGVAT